MTPPATTRLLLETDALQVGEFTCVPAHPLWNEVNDNIGARPHLVFPQTSVYIDQGGSRRVLATPNHVVFYASHALYRRELHDPRGDVCIFVTVDPELFKELVGDTRTPLGSSDADTYLAVHTLVRELQDGTTRDPLLVEESLQRLVARAGVANGERRRPARTSTRQGHRELAEAAKDLIARRLTGSLALGELAADLHTSPFHLVRVFRDETGFTLHDYRLHLRLRRSFEHLLDPDCDLTRIALELGFCSLSHFSGSFRRKFGIAPSAVRMGGRELSKIVEARLAGAS
jgi:AraC family transcriptional regulator